MSWSAQHLKQCLATSDGNITEKCMDRLILSYPQLTQNYRPDKFWTRVCPNMTYKEGLDWMAYTMPYMKKAIQTIGVHLKRTLST